jgi:TonB family protein
MGYQALLFCPDEKTARTVTQVLGELEFTVEACIEPFAAVKKLMSDHFDAVVVDCDNEQNATLLFKSARNSTSNQASLAVAVVEGQAGVAKAFRIGANLVLTKPINIEQSKGTLRVARGLLRKGDPAKPLAPAASAPAATPAKPAAPRPVPPARPAAPAAVSTPRPASPPVVKPATAAPPKVAAANSAPVARDHVAPDHKEALPEIRAKQPVAPPPVSIAAPTAPAPRQPILGGHTASIDVTSGFSSAAPAAPFGSGAASAPAPAREVQTHAAEISPASEADVFPAKPVEPANDAPSFVGSAPSFTFGGANVPAESSAGKKKILLGVVAAVVVAAALYFGWSYFQGRETQPSSIPATTRPAPITTPPIGNLSTSSTTSSTTISPKPALTAPATAPTSSNAQPAVQPPADDTQATDAEDNDSGTKNPAASGSTKPASSASSAAGKTAATKPEAAPLVVKGGSVPAVHAKPAAPDTAAPSLIGMATPGSSAPPPNLVNDTGNGAAPVLQALNISQGVSQGLLIKKVQPIYPRNALTMHSEGTVDLMATISTTGSITAVKVVSGDPLLTKAASDAVKQWKYKPYLLNGEPVEIQTEITINFKLPH